jgi:hypothetical protein
MLLIKFPSRQRPSKLETTLEKYVKMASNPTLIKFLITLDSDDTTVTPQLINTLKSYHTNINVIVGKSGSKIIAVNRDMENAGDFDIVLLASDDMLPEVEGYDEIIRDKMKEHYPDTDGVLWFNDGFQQNKLNTLCILGRKYYERFGYIYHPAYLSLFCDNEFTDVANFLNKQTYFNQIIIRHDHPIIYGRDFDALYTHNEQFSRHDMRTYFARRSINFGLY